MALAFRLKVYTEIISGMFNTAMAALGPAVDLNPGSYIRTILEAASIQDAEQYAQIGKLLDYFAIDNITDDDLDRRALDYGTNFQVNLRRRAASQSHALVGMQDTTYTQVATVLLNNTPAGVNSFIVPSGTGALFPVAGRLTLDRGTSHEESFFYSRSGDVFTTLAGYVLAFGHLSGAPVNLTSVASTITNNVPVTGTVVDLSPGTGAAFPSSGFVILGRETANRELVGFIISGDVMTIAPATKSHSIGDSAILSTVGVDRFANVGAEIYVPSTLSTPEIPFTLDTGITLFDGDFQSALVGATSKFAGSATLAGAGTIIAFRIPPFTTAQPFNPYPATQGRDRESDSDYIQRIKDTVQSLAGLTALTITTDVNGLTDPVSQQTVGFAQLIDAVAPGLSLLYVTDGSTTFGPSRQMVSGREVLVNVASGGDRRATFAGSPPITVVSTPGIQTPAPPRIVQVGVAGAFIYTYIVVAVVGSGAAPSASQTTNTGPTTLSVSNYNQVTWEPVDGAVSYDLYRVFGGATLGKIASVAAGSTLLVNDTGLAGDGSTPPATNTSITNSSAITPRVFRSSIRGLATSVGVGYLEDSTQTFGINALVGQVLKTDDGQFFTITSNTAIRMNFAGSVTPSLGAYSVFDFSQPPLIPTVDYEINDSTGDIELVVPLLQYDGLVAADDNNTTYGAYIKTTGLIAYVQKVINGVPTDIQNFPGLVAPGCFVRVLAPTIVSPQFVIRALPSTGTLDATFKAAVIAAASRYVNSLGVGDTILLSRIITDAETDVPTLEDIQILSPAANIPVLAGQLPRVTDANFLIV